MPRAHGLIPGPAPGFEPLTEVVGAEGPANEGGAEIKEGGVEIVAAFVPDEEASCCATTCQARPAALRAAMYSA